MLNTTPENFLFKYDMDKYRHRICVYPEVRKVMYRIPQALHDL